MPSRSDERDRFDQPTRVALLEADADRTETNVVALQATLTKILWLVVTTLIALATSAVLFAINLATGVKPGAP